MTDLFDSKSISPMLIGAEGEAFDSPDYLYELKLDGVRCLAYVGDGKTVLCNKRNLLVSPIYPELSGIHQQVKGRCILDGELVVIVDGKPQFAEMQRRALMSDPFKIELTASKHPVSFTAFDLLYQDGKDLTGKPLVERKERLIKAVRENDRIAVSRAIEGCGMALYAITENQGLEGVVAKRKNSLYYQGKRTKDWIKCKHLLDDDFVICGYIHKSAGAVSLVLGQKRGEELVYKGHVTLGVSRTDFCKIEAMPVISESPFPVDGENKQAVWIEPSLVCAVKFMERTANGGLRQPVYKGLRDDKRPEDCIVKT